MLKHLKHKLYGPMLGIRSMGVGEYQSEDSFICFGAKPTQRACTRDFLQEQKKMRKDKVPRQSTEDRSLQQSGKGDGQREAAAEEGAGIFGPRSQVTQCERMCQRSW